MRRDKLKLQPIDLKVFELILQGKNIYGMFKCGLPKGTINKSVKRLRKLGIFEDKELRPTEDALKKLFEAEFDRPSLDVARVLVDNGVNAKLANFIQSRLQKCAI